MRRALLDGFEAHGFLPPGEPPRRVLVKPNLLRPTRPDSAITTHPTVLVEAVRILRERGHTVAVGDSPGIGTARGNLRSLGCLSELEGMGATVVPLGSPKPVRLSSGRAVPISELASSAEVLLNLAKWKTHVQTGLTGAVKNLYGCVSGPRKALQHVAYGHREREFLEMLVGIAAHLRPALSVVDGVVAMEGNGPGGGTPKPVGFIFSGRDPVALDRTLATLMGFEELGLFQVARSMGVGETDPGRIRSSGDPLPPRVAPPFLLPRPRPLTFDPLRRALSLLRCEKRGFLLQR